MFFERKYTTCLADMPRQRIPQTQNAIKIGNLEGSRFYGNLSNGPLLEDRKLCKDPTSSK